MRDTEDFDGVVIMEASRPVALSDEFAPFLLECIPKNDELTLPDGRLLQAYRELVGEAFQIARMVLGWSRVKFESKNFIERRREDGRAVSRSSGYWGPNDLCVILPGLGGKFSIQETAAGTPHLLAEAFVGVVASTLGSAVQSVQAIRRTQIATGPKETAYEIMVAGLRAHVMSAFLQKLIEQPDEPIVRFLLGKRPFSAPFHTSFRIQRWWELLPSQTYEGNAISTGIVVVSGAKKLRGSRDISVTNFESPFVFGAHGVPRQVQALASSERDFLIVSPTGHVVGLATLRQPLADSGKVSEAEKLLPFQALWIQIVAANRVRLFGSHGRAFTEIGHIRDGQFQLWQRARAEDALGKALAETVSSKALVSLPMLARQLLDRALLGLGGGLVIATGHSFEGQRPATPVAIDDHGHWLAFFNPDGAVVCDCELRIVRYGVRLPQPVKALLPEKGTRHNALAAVTIESNNVAIAISDDGALTVFKHGQIAEVVC